MKKILLSTVGSEPLTIEKNGEFVILRQHFNKLKLGKEIAQWVYDTLKNAGSQQQHYADDIGVLEINSTEEGIHIAGVSSHFLLNQEAYKQLLEWFEEDYFALSQP